MKLITKILAGLMLALMVVYATGCENNNGKNTGNSTGNNTGNTVNETVNETILVNDLGYVDLGLPSGNLWATCNIGANAPEESGDFFAWGEIEKKPTYEWLNYKHCADGERGKLTKYCPYASEGNHDFRDALKVLQPEDDAASALMGDDWRMPDKEEYKELFRNTDRKWTAINGVDGYLLTARNGSGNSIFLPACGYSLDGKLIAVGEGYYWSSLLFDGYDLEYDDPNLAWCLIFSSSNWCVDGTQRCVGMSVRPVRSLQ